MYLFSCGELSPSPVHLAFPHIQWNNNSNFGGDSGSVVTVSHPEQSLLSSAEENPLEYTLADANDAFWYTRTLLKVLDRLTTATTTEGPFSSSSLTSNSHLHQAPLPTTTTTTTSQSSSKTVVSNLSLNANDRCTAEDAYDYYHRWDPTGVVIHYVIRQLYNVVGIVLERQNETQQRKQRRKRRQQCHSGNINNDGEDDGSGDEISIASLFYHRQQSHLYYHHQQQEQQLLDDCWRPLLRLLYQRRDDYAQRGAALVLAYILTRAGGEPKDETRSSGSNTDETLQSLIAWVTSRLQFSSSQNSLLGVVTPTLVVLATSSKARMLFRAAGGIGYVARHLKQIPQQQQQKQQQRRRRQQQQQPMNYNNNNNTHPFEEIRSQPPPLTVTRTITGDGVQQLYELTFCMWTMTFDCLGGDGIDEDDSSSSFHRDGAIVALCGLLQSTPREKVVRLAIASLRNLAFVTDPTLRKLFLRDMIACGLLQRLSLLQEQRQTQWRKKDHQEEEEEDDTLRDIRVLQTIVQEYYNELTKWDVYRTELESKQLTWSSFLHTDRFFQHHALCFERDDFQPLQRLIQLLREWTTTTTITSMTTITKNMDNLLESSVSIDEDDWERVAVCLFDIGAFIKHYPNGKGIVKRFLGGSTTLLIRLLEYPLCPEIQQQALLCVSRLLLGGTDYALETSLAS